MGDEKKQKTGPRSVLSEDQRQKIAAALEARGATQACPRCSNKTFTVLEGYFTHPLSPSVGMILGGPAVPVAVVACNNCGFLSEHALGTLGLLEREADK